MFCWSCFRSNCVCCLHLIFCNLHISCFYSIFSFYLLHPHLLINALHLFNALHTLLMYSMFSFPPLYLLNNFIILFIYLFIYFILENIFENYKKIKYIKKIKKGFSFTFIVSVRSLAPCDTYFLKNTKNSFLSPFVSVRPLASCDTYFQLIQNTKNNTKFSKYKNINIFKQRRLFKNYMILDSPP